ncbi:MAG: hypothetical protein JSW54_04095, partial [Fidelibacterota bacterium]
KIEIWSRPLDFDLRGSHRWMQDVITHEFVHIIQLGTAMKFTRQIPSLYFQFLNYEDEKRDDVLYGYPNVLASYPVPGVNIPPWLAEGVAQLMYPGANYDFWDTHRDMILRDRVVNDDLLSFTAMSSFGKRGIGNESVYNQGFAFAAWLADRFGMKALEDVSRTMASPLSLSISRALKRVTGVSGIQLYREWKAALEERYDQEMAQVFVRPVTGEIIFDVGTANMHPVWNPVARQFAFLSNKRSDFFGQTDLYIYDFSTRKARRVAEATVSAPCWSADGTTLYFAARSEPGKTGARWLELFAYDTSSRKKKRLTQGERVTSPVLLSSRREIAYLTVEDGTSNIKLFDMESKEITTLTDYHAGEYIHSLTYDPVDRSLYFDATINHGRQLMQLRLTEGQIVAFEPLTADSQDQGDFRDPISSGDNLLLSTDVSGVFNLYQVRANGERGYITNVVGGAFMPSVNAQGEVLYSLYHQGAYKIAYLASPELLDEDQVGIPGDLRKTRPDSPQESPDMTRTAVSYTETFSRPFFLPRLMLDYGTLKPGFYFYANEVLDRLLLFGGASMNSRKDTDLFLLFEFRKFRPTLYAQFFAIRRHVSQDFKYYDYLGTNDLRFSLVEAVVGGRMPLGWNRFWLEGTLSQYQEHIFQRLEDMSGGFSFTYYKGASVTARWQLMGRRPEYGGNMFPTKGFEVEVELRGEKNELAEDFTISRKYSTAVTIYDPNHTLRLTANLRSFLPINRERRITAAYDATLGWLSNANVDTFFYFFGGGPPGLRGYTYYDSTVQGTNLMIHTLTLRVPVFLEQNIPFLHLILQNAALGFIAQFGDGFNGSWLKHRYKTSVGMEMRLNGFNFYVFPFALKFEAHRPVQTDIKGNRYYVSLLFDF